MSGALKCKVHAIEHAGRGSHSPHARRAHAAHGRSKMRLRIGVTRVPFAHDGVCMARTLCVSSAHAKGGAARHGARREDRHGAPLRRWHSYCNNGSLTHDGVTFLAISEAFNEADSDAQRLRQRYFGVDVPFMEHIGLMPVSLEKDCCVTRLAWQPHLVNSRGDMHGGSLMSAMDFTLSAAARAHDPSHLGVITIDMSTHFYEPARTSLTIVGRCVRHGRSMAFCDGEVRDENGLLVAVARAVFKLIRQPGAQSGAQA
jgi:uncharacterized protein (TIGR00369 family)